MDQHKKKLEIVKKHYKSLGVTDKIFFSEDLKPEGIKALKDKFAYEMNPQEFLFFYCPDDKYQYEGYVFTDDSVYYFVRLSMGDGSFSLEEGTIKYENITEIGRFDLDLVEIFYDETVEIWIDEQLNLASLCSMINGIILADIAENDCPKIAVYNPLNEAIRSNVVGNDYTIDKTQYPESVVDSVVDYHDSDSCFSEMKLLPGNELGHYTLRIKHAYQDKEYRIGEKYVFVLFNKISFEGVFISNSANKDVVNKEDYCTLDFDIEATIDYSSCFVHCDAKYDINDNCVEYKVSDRVDIEDINSNNCSNYSIVYCYNKNEFEDKTASDGELDDIELPNTANKFNNNKSRQHEEKSNILRKYSREMGLITHIFYDKCIPRLINNATEKFAHGLDSTTVIGFYDTSFRGNGKSGYVFTDDKIYYSQTLDKPAKIWYDDIKSVEVVESGKKDCDNVLKIFLYDGTVIRLSDVTINKTPLCRFLQEMIEYENGEKNSFSAEVEYNRYNVSGAIAGGIATGAYGQVNKLYDEEKFHAQQGHGFAAERANTLYDKLTGHDAKIVGDDNVKNGADRIVDGVMIQSKYCQSGSACVNECFDNNGNFKYMVDGKPMQIEVPSDKYDAAVQAMEKKIQEGKVPGVTDPNEAKNIVRKGHFTYEQAKNIAKAGTVESLAYDATNGAIIATSAFGITAVITLAVNLWNGEDFGTSLKVATYSGLKVGGTAFITTILASQLSKAGLNSALVSSSEAVVSFMGPKASAILINAFRSGSNIYGAAAMKSAAKLLRGNAIAAVVSVGVLSSFDLANIIRGRISGKQLFKNLTNTATSVVGGTGGWLGGAAIGAAILPGPGSVIGGLIGSVAAGAIASKATNAVLDNFVEDDADEMVGIIQDEFEVLAREYLLNQKEAERSIDKLSDKLNGKTLKDMFASQNRKKFARQLLIPIIENETKKRKHIQAVSNEMMALSLREVLENIADNYDETDNTVLA